jgi:hypothetical protein
MVSLVEGCNDETRRFKWGRKESGKRERTAKRRSAGGEEVSPCDNVQKEAERTDEDECIAANVDMIASSKGIMWNVEKKRADVRRPQGLTLEDFLNVCCRFVLRQLIE